MPRGGRRRGAGAPKGNFNAVRSGNHSTRLLMTYFRLQIELDGPLDKVRTLGEELIRERLIVIAQGRLRLTGDFSRVLEYLYQKWFDPPEPT